MRIASQSTNTFNTENTEMRLTIQHGKFVLVEVEDAKIRSSLSKDARWESGADDSFSTIDLGAARKFRKFSDERTSKLFKKTFQEHYELPKLPELPLDPHQWKGLKWILSRKRSYIAHAPGAGKTAQAIIAACLTTGHGRIIFVVPPALTVNWEREIYKFTEWVGNYGKVAIVPTSDRQNEMDWSAEFVVVPDSMLTKDWVYTKLLELKDGGIRFLAVDEASRFKESTVERTIALFGGRRLDRDFPGIFQKARHVALLDGSPMPNRPMELFAPTFALHPEAIDCKTYDDFGYRYCGAKPNERGQWEYLYSSNEEELHQKITQDFMHVVTEDELDHPERQRSMVVMNEDVRTAEHKTWERKHLGDGTGISVLGESSSTGDLARFRRKLGLRKVPWVARYVRERINEKNESILLFVWHREVAAELFLRLHKKPGDVAVINGSVEPALRDEWFTEFQEGNTKLLIMNIAAAGRGINLQRADRVIFGEFSWTDETNKQAEKRASRRGNDRDFVRCEYICCPDSMDEIVLRSVFSKEKRVKRIIG